MLDLFILETCPYCRKVISFLDEKGVKYNKVDITDKPSEEALIKMGGKDRYRFWLILIETYRCMSQMILLNI